jgi:hypothetical protein
MAAQGDWSAGEQPVVIYGMGKKGVNSPLAQPFINYNFPHGWYLSSSPIFTAIIMLGFGSS